MAELRAVGFESFVRSNPNVKRLETAWRGTPEFDTWMEVYLDPTNTTVEYLEEDDHKIGTFYRVLTDFEVEKAEAVAEENQRIVSEADKPKRYEVLGIVHEHADERMSHKVWHVKLGIPRWVPVGERYGLCEYVLVDQMRENVSDDNGAFVYATTSVTVTDENVEQYEDASPIYVAPSVLDVFEVMFAIGEIGEYDANAV